MSYRQNIQSFGGIQRVQQARIKIALRLLSRATLPLDISTALATLKFVDMKTQQILEQGHAMFFGTEGSFETYLIGYGVSGMVKNDIVVDVGKDTATGQISCTITKLAANPVQVLKNDAELAVLAEFTAVDMVYAASISTMLT